MTTTHELEAQAGRTEADAVAEIATRQTDSVQRVDAPRTGDNPAVAFWFDRDGVEVLRQDLTPTHERTVKVHTAAAAVTYCRPFVHAGDDQQPRSTLWADADSTRITVVLDDHNGGYYADADHRCQLDLRHDPDFAEWRKIADGDVDQDRLALFLEERVGDVVDPAGADLLEVARTFTATASGTFKRARSLHNGSTQLEWTEDVQGRAGAGGETEVPNDIRIRVPVFQGGDPVEIDGKFRYRVKSGRLALRVKLLNVHTVIRDAMADIASDVADDLGVELIEGVAP